MTYLYYNRQKFTQSQVGVLLIFNLYNSQVIKDTNILIMKTNTIMLLYSTKLKNLLWQ